MISSWTSGAASKRGPAGTVMDSNHAKTAPSEPLLVGGGYNHPPRDAYRLGDAAPVSPPVQAVAPPPVVRLAMPVAKARPSGSFRSWGFRLRRFDWTGVILTCLGILFIGYGIFGSLSYGWFYSKAPFMIGGRVLDLDGFSITPFALLIGLNFIGLFLLWRQSLKKARPSGKNGASSKLH